MTQRKMPVIDTAYARYLGLTNKAGGKPKRTAKPKDTDTVIHERPHPYYGGFSFNDNNSETTPMPRRTTTTKRTPSPHAQAQAKAKTVNEVEARVKTLIAKHGFQPVNTLRALYADAHGADIAADMKASCDRFTNPDDFALGKLVQWRQEARR